ncbi:MAG TPA: cysteine desulfurase family protein [Candidatus Paceibacterota bacterium]|nr:cysteine desulfurase family protein [Candidatus Paceibacterota bacterium]
MRKSTRIYLDHAATTPVDPAVFEVMKPYFSENYGNAGSLHSFGQAAITAIDEARSAIAKAIDAEFDEVIFTGGATEANNLALRGALKRKDREPRPKVIVSFVEHESVLDTARDFEREGAEVVYLPVDGSGFVDLVFLKKNLDERTVLVSVMYAQNEIGTIQPVAEIAEILRDFRDGGIYPLFHTDAVQAFQFLDCNVNRLGVDLMTLSAHKIYGPKGAGALYIRNGVKDALAPVLTGGGQEFGFRSGTENVPAIAGFAKAVKLAVSGRVLEGSRLAGLKARFWDGLKEIFPLAERNGGEPSLPNILNVHFPGKSSEELILALDAEGIAVSSGSACGSRVARPSHVLQALGFPPERVKSSIRFSFGRSTSAEDVEKTLAALDGLLRRNN